MEKKNTVAVKTKRQPNYVFKVLKTCVLLVLLVFSPLISYGKDESKPEFKKYFDEYNLRGNFVLYDRNNKKYIRYNPERAKQRFIPASTFKIVNSLIGLEIGEIPDDNFVFKWKGEKRALPAWEKDFKFGEAFQASCVPCYQELARKIGAKRMRHWLDKINYGNEDISGGIDLFWLTGGLRISPNEKVKFIQRLYENKLPFSQKNMNTVKKIMRREDGLYGKSGWQTADLNNPNGSHSLGWFVGYLEKDGNVYFFATNVETENTLESFAASRVAITKNILKDLCLFQN